MLEVKVEGKNGLMLMEEEGERRWSRMMKRLLESGLLSINSRKLLGWSGALQSIG
jgi:hypothetical protein